MIEKMQEKKLKRISRENKIRRGMLIESEMMAEGHLPTYLLFPYIIYNNYDFVCYRQQQEALKTGQLDMNSREFCAVFCY